MGARVWWRIIFGVLLFPLLVLPLSGIEGIGWISLAGIIFLWWMSVRGEERVVETVTEVELVEVEVPVPVVEKPADWVGMLYERVQQIMEETGCTEEQANKMVYYELGIEHDLY